MKREGKFYIADRSLWLTVDRLRVVEDGDPEARFLYARPGTRILTEFAEAQGLVEPKAKKKSPNKAAKRSVNKSKKG